MRKTAILLVITMLISALSGFSVFAEEATPAAKGPQAEAFDVSSTEVTSLSPMYYTNSNIYIADPANPWYNIEGRNYATLEAGSTFQKFVAYDLNVEKAGAYQITAYIGTTSDKAAARLYRPGKVKQSTDPNFSESGDVILSEISVKKTATAVTKGANDFGTIWLDEGINRIAVSAVAASGVAIYYLGMDITPVSDPSKAPIIMSVRDAKELKNADGTDEPIYGSIATHANPYISFGPGDYSTYDVEIQADGLYSFTVFGGYGNYFTVTDITDSENPVTLISSKKVDANGEGTFATPVEIGKLNFTKGTHTLKLTCAGSSHYSYFTLRKIAEPLGEKVSYAANGETLKVDRTLYSVSTGGANLDFGYNGYRIYKVYAQTAGDYDFVLNYSAWNEISGMTVNVNGADILADALENCNGYANYKDVNMGKISLKKGLNQVKLIPESTINMPHFTLVPSYIANVNAAECANVTDDALTIVKYNGKNVVKLTNGQKLDFKVTTEAEGNYDIFVNASVSLGARTVSVKSGDEVLATVDVSGQQHSEYSYIKIATVELYEGENNLSLSLDSGYYAIFNTIMAAAEFVPEPEPTPAPTAEPTAEPTATPVPRGPQTEPFEVAEEGETTLSPVYFTNSNIYIGDATKPWYNNNNFATLEGGAGYQKFVAYDLNVTKAGNYRVIAEIGTTNDKAVARLLRPGKVTPSTDSSFTESGDVILSEVAVKQTTNNVIGKSNDFGAIWLDEGINRIAISNVAEAGNPALYLLGVKIVPTDDEAQIVMSVRDAKEIKNYDGTDEYFYTIISTPATPYISFGSGDYSIYDVNIQSDGLYSFTTFAGGGNIYTVTDITDSENPVTLINAVKVPSNGVGTVASPYEIGKINLTKGTHTLKLTATQSNHYSYFTLRKVMDAQGVKTVYAPIGEDVNVRYDDFSKFKHSAGLDFTDSMPGTGEWVEAWREYTIYAEKAGDYDFVVNYSAKDDVGIIAEVNGEEVFADVLESTGAFDINTAKDINFGNIRLNKGVNVIKLTPEGTFNMPHFKLLQKGSIVAKASDASNIESDGLETIDYNDGTSVKLTKEQKLDLSITAPKAGYYVLRANASSNVGTRKITVKSGDNVLLETDLVGSAHREYAISKLGVVYLTEGENALTLSLDSGYYAYFEKLSAEKIEANLYNGETLVQNVTAGTLTAKVDLNGLYAGETKSVYFAIYKTDSKGVKRLAYVNMENIEIVDGEETEIAISDVALESGYTYNAKMFVLDGNMNGAGFEF